MIKTGLIAVCILLGMNYTLAQETAIDKLLAKEKKATSNVSKSTILAKISDEYLKLGDQKSIVYAEKALEKALISGKQKNKADALTALGQAQSRINGDYDEGMDNIKKALKIYQALGDKDGLMTVNNALSIGENINGNDDKAIEYLQKCLEYSIELKDSAMASKANYNIGVIYTQRFDSKIAISYFENALTYAQMEADPYFVACVKSGIANCYFDMDDKERAIQYIESSKPELSRINHFFLKNQLMSQIAMIYNRCGLQDSAIVYAKESYDNFLEKDHVEGTMLSGLILGEVYLDQDRNEDAFNVFKSGLELAKETGSSKKMAAFYHFLSEYYDKIEDYKLSKEYLILEAEIDDSIYSIQKELIIADIRTKYETEKKERQLQEKESSLALLKKKNQISRQQWYIGGIIGFSLFLLIFHFMNRARVKHKRDSNDAKQKLIEKNKELNRFSAQLKEKIELIGELTKENEEKINDKTREIGKLSILTEEDWLYFKNLFGEIHIDFMEVILSFEPKLTESELRLLMLEKLGFSQKHMTHTLGVLANSIRQTRLRLRKKIGVSVETNLVEYMEE